METHHCNNCEQPFQGNYCSNCGQKLSANQRLRIVQIVREFFDNTFNLHRGFFFTFWKLITVPAWVFRSYIGGMRKTFTNPSRYLVIALAALALNNFWFGANEVIESEEFSAIPFLSESLNQSLQWWGLQLVTEYTLLANLFEALIFPFGFYWTFRKQRYSYAELLTLSFYLISNSIFIVVLIVGLPKFLFGYFAPAFMVVGIITLYYLYALISFFKETPLVKRIFMVLLGLFIFWFLRLLITPLLLALLFPVSGIS